MNKLSVNSSMAVLSEASYGNFSNVYSAGFYDQQAVIDAITDKSDKNNFSATQAAEFVTHWRVVDHQPETTSGFSATLFQRIDTDPDSGLKDGDYVFANQGTEPKTASDLIIADALGIVFSGKAGQQIADMYRYCGSLRMTRPQPLPLEVTA